VLYLEDLAVAALANTRHYPIVVGEFASLFRDERLGADFDVDVASVRVAYCLLSSVFFQPYELGWLSWLYAWSPANSAEGLSLEYPVLFSREI
jgi:hypothetical protein